MSILRTIRLPDLFSLLNALLGFISILAAYGGEPNISILLIILAAAADGLDGFLARRFGSGPLGVNLDSFADLVSFGIAPAVLASMAFHLPWQAGILGGVYLTCGMLRLARFNVAPKNDRFFEGLPIPPCGIAVAASVLLGFPEFTLSLMFVFSGFMISSIPYPKIRDLRTASLLGLVFLAAAFLVLARNNHNFTAILLYSTITTMIIYVVSPVVIPFLRRER